MNRLLSLFLSVILISMMPMTVFAEDSNIIQNVNESVSDEESDEISEVEEETSAVISEWRYTGNGLGK